MIQERHYGKNHWQTASMLNNLAIAYGSLGQGRDQMEFLERVLKIEEQHYGKNHWQVAMTLNNLACTLREIGNISAALDYARRAKQIFIANFENSDHPHIKNIDELIQQLEKLQQPSIEKKATSETKAQPREFKATATLTDAKTDTIDIALEERALNYVQRLQQVLGTTHTGKPIVRHGEKASGLRWVSFSSFWLKQLPPKAIEELSKELHVDRNCFQTKGPDQ